MKCTPISALLLAPASVFLWSATTLAFSASSYAPMKRTSFISPSQKFGRPCVVLNGAAEDEAERLREQAKKLREEAATLSGKDEEPQPSEKEVAAEKQSGDLYDDEVAPYKDPLSDTMRARLMKEASTGLDSNQKQTNVILYISIAVAVLVLLGGQGILY